jgi:hypothetical protein
MRIKSHEELLLISRWIKASPGEFIRKIFTWHEGKMTWSPSLPEPTLTEHTHHVINRQIIKSTISGTFDKADGHPVNTHGVAGVATCTYAGNAL